MGGTLNRIILFLSIFVMSFTATANDLDKWADSQYQISVVKLLKNVSPDGAGKGAVIASPSRREPDYWFHWVRDGALVMDVVLQMYKNNKQETARAYFLNHLLDFVKFTRINQNSYSPVDLGEPKYFVDGRAYDGPWGRPQNDGPALRARTLIKFAEVLLSEGKTKYVREHLYNNDPRKSVIKRDLEYVAHNWYLPSFDLWEEVKGQHFYTLMVQAVSLLEGADLAIALGDSGAGTFYRRQAELINQRIREHYSTGNPFIVENMHRVEGLNYKHSGLDTATVLAFLHSSGRYVSNYANSYLLSTIKNIEAQFDAIYPINNVRKSGKHALASSFGRYPEDQYFGGNPWFLTSLAIAEHHYVLATQMKHNPKDLLIDAVNRDFYNALLGLNGNKSIQAGARIDSRSQFYQVVRQALKAKADAIFARVRHHAGRDGSLDEQLDRQTGYMLSARDLTWSYASYITAYWMRNLAR